MITRAGVVVEPPEGTTFYCTTCEHPVRANVVRERIQAIPPVRRDLFHSATMRDWRECGGAVEVRPIEVAA